MQFPMWVPCLHAGRVLGLHSIAAFRRKLTGENVSCCAASLHGSSIHGKAPSLLALRPSNTVPGKVAADHGAHQVTGIAQLALSGVYNHGLIVLAPECKVVFSLPCICDTCKIAADLAL